MGGCPRSGTTALARLLNAHPRVLIGDERYYWPFENRRVTPDLFGRARFLDLREDDRHWAEGREPWPPGDPAARFDAASHIGDKYPRLADVAEHLAETLPDAQLVWIVRNPLSVAESDEARRADDADAWHFGLDRALDDWNQGVGGALRHPGALVLSYERLFVSGGDLARLFRALDLDPAPAMDEAGTPLRGHPLRGRSACRLARLPRRDGGSLPAGLGVRRRAGIAAGSRGGHDRRPNRMPPGTCCPMTSPAVR